MRPSGVMSLVVSATTAENLACMWTCSRSRLGHPRAEQLADQFQNGLGHLRWVEGLVDRLRQRVEHRQLAVAAGDLRGAVGNALFEHLRPLGDLRSCEFDGLFLFG